MCDKEPNGRTDILIANAALHNVAQPSTKQDIVNLKHSLRGR